MSIVHAWKNLLKYIKMGPREEWQKTFHADFWFSICFMELQLSSFVNNYIIDVFVMC